MPPASIAFGVILIVLGAGFYVGTGSASMTALIPSFVGIVFVLLGVVGLKEGLRKHAMHAAAALALVGFIGTAAMGFPKLVKHLSGTEIERPVAAIEQSVMSVLCLLFVILCVRSFIAARRARAERGQE